MKKFLTGLLLSAFAVCGANATTISFTAVKSGVGPYGSYAADPTTGKVYRRDSFNGGNTLFVYDSEADLVANNVAQTVILSSGSFYGTYFAVQNGMIYGRTGSSGTGIARWDATSGTLLETRASIPGMGGANGTHTFDWGGFSGVNWMNDSTGLYVFGRNSANSDWQINQMTPGDLGTIVSTTTYAPPSVGSFGNLGYGFVINGTLFTGDDFDDTSVTTAVDVASGAVSAVGFTLTGIGEPFVYLSQFSYDHATDTLYALNQNTSTLYKAANASVQFEVPLSIAVPAPGAMILMGIGVLALGVSRRQRPV